MRRAGGLTRRRSPLGDGKGAGNCLGILFKCGPAEVKFFVVFVGYGNRADLLALTAACAFGKIYIARSLMNFSGKTSRLAFESQKFGICEKLNVQMTADLDQFW